MSVTITDDSIQLTIKLTEDELIILDQSKTAPIPTLKGPVYVKSNGAHRRIRKRKGVRQNLYGITGQDHIGSHSVETEGGEND